MKRILSLFLIIVVLFSFGFNAIAEETTEVVTFKVLYTLPTGAHNYSKNKIPVNQKI